MKKTIIPIFLSIILFAGGVVAFYRCFNVPSPTPVNYNSLHSSDILPDMYIGSYTSLVYGSFAYFGESEEDIQKLFYVTATGIDCEAGGQFMAFLISDEASPQALAQIDKTEQWLQGDELELPTGFPIWGVVKPLPLEINQYFQDFFIETSEYTQEDINDNPQLFSSYYIDTTESATSVQENSLAFIGLVLFGLSFLIIAATAASSKRSRDKYDFEHSTKNRANASLEDSTSVPMGFEK